VDLSVSAVILCGGKGRRLGGVEKAYIRNSNGEPLWLALIQVLSTVTTELVFVMREEQADGFRNQLKNANADPLRDKINFVFDPGRGPAHALIEAAQSAQSDCLLVTGVDHPHVELGLVHSLLANWSSKADAVAVKRLGQKGEDKSWEPLWALYRRAGLLRLATTRDWRDQSLKELLNSLKPVELTQQSDAFASINDLDDLRCFGCTLPTASP